MKQYIKPETLALRIEMGERLMAGSPDQATNSVTRNDDLAKRNGLIDSDVWDYEDEEEW